MADTSLMGHSSDGPKYEKLRNEGYCESHPDTMPDTPKKTFLNSIWEKLKIKKTAVQVKEKETVSVQQPTNIFYDDFDINPALDPVFPSATSLATGSFSVSQLLPENVHNDSADYANQPSLQKLTNPMNEGGSYGNLGFSVRQTSNAPLKQHQSASVSVLSGSRPQLTRQKNGTCQEQNKSSASSACFALRPQLTRQVNHMILKKQNSASDPISYASRPQLRRQNAVAIDVSPTTFDEQWNVLVADSSDTKAKGE
ncbi:unnamed protein product [Caenorhabditis sp. 36 PRJEB53466]|nr:unnamed protein product [Caenorhabditis sp. 36 PRJEB53466]